jgi:superfamily II DNA or RNA helicase
VFVDDALNPCADQWSFLASVQSMAPHDIEPTILRGNGIRCDLLDERFSGEPLDVRFAGTLRPYQEDAVAAMLGHDTGILCAPTAFGKTVAAAAVIARRGVNTLVLVHRTELLKQWQERLQAFLTTDEPGKGVIGTLGGGQAKPTGRIDIAMMQSLHRRGETSERIEKYGHIVVDECHHLSAVSFEAILKRAKAKYVLGLTATPIRRDGRQPIIFMQCGPTRHAAARPTGALQTLEVMPRYLSAHMALAADAGIQDVFRTLAGDTARTVAIADEISSACAQGHKVLVLTERTEHLDAIGTALATRVPALFTLHGRMSKKQRAALVGELDALPPDAPRVLLSTGHPALLRMWDKRQRGYRAMGYHIPPTAVSDNLDFETAPSDAIAMRAPKGDMKAGRK